MATSTTTTIQYSGGGGVVHNYGANSLQIKTLPLASASTSPITYVCIDADGIEIDVTGSDFIVAGDTSGNGTALSSTSVGSSVTLAPVPSSNKWVIVGITGSWIMGNNPVVTTGLVASWSFDSGLLASYPPGKTLTQNGTVTYPSGKLGAAALFNANAANYLSLAGVDTAFNFANNDFTVAVWVYLNNAANWQIISTNYDGNGFLFRIGGIVQFHIDPGAVNSNTSLSTGVWYHIVCRRSSGTFTIWINGVLDKTTTLNSIPNATTNLKIGWWNGYSFDGNIDDLSFWNVAISDADIATLYSSGGGASVSGGSKILTGLR